MYKGSLKNVDTEHISNLLTDNVISFVFQQNGNIYPKELCFSNFNQSSKAGRKPWLLVSVLYFSVQ